MSYLSVISVFAWLLFVAAIVNQIKDARYGYSFETGSDGWFSMLWFIASVLLSIVVMQIFQWQKLVIIPMTIVVFGASYPVKAIIKKLFLGKGLKKPSAK